VNGSARSMKTKGPSRLRGPTCERRTRVGTPFSHRGEARTRTSKYLVRRLELRSVLAVVKMRGSDHSRALRSYGVTPRGLEVRDAMTDYPGITTGVPERRSGPSEPAQGELTTTEAIVLDVMLRLGETSAAGVSSESGIPVEQIRHVIDRLVTVGYVRAVERDQTTLYRASPRSLR